MLLAEKAILKEVIELALKSGLLKDKAKLRTAKLRVKELRLKLGK